jgi:GT2 family glycosyltransferase
MPFAQTANLAVRREVLSNIGLFRPYIFSGGDADLCWRFEQKTGEKLKFIKKAFVMHPASRTLEELRRKFYIYGIGDRVLSHIYKIELLDDYGVKNILMALIRWLLKELPIKIALRFAGKSDIVDLAATPIRLIIRRARMKGALSVSWNEKMREIARLQRYLKIAKAKT